MKILLILLSAAFLAACQEDPADDLLVQEESRWNMYGEANINDTSEIDAAEFQDGDDFFLGYAKFGDITLKSLNDLDGKGNDVVTSTYDGEDEPETDVRGYTIPPY